MNLIFSINDPTNNISCWGQVLAEDKLAPILTGRTVDLSCDSDLSPDSIGFPFDDAVNVTEVDGSFIAEKGADNCSESSLAYFDSYKNLSCESAYSQMIIRTWNAVDEGGLSSSTNDTIRVLRPILADLVLPGNFDGIDNPHLKCEDRGVAWDTLPNGHPSPEISGFVGGLTCEQLFISYEDVRINVCESEPNACFKILRTWKILDWCSGDIFNHEQIIKSLDDQAPVIIAPADHTLNADLWCKGFISVAPPEISDNCSEVNAYNVYASSGSVDYNQAAGNFTITNLEKGAIEIYYEAFDCCGNFGYDTTVVMLIDVSPPVAICHEHTTVALSVSEEDDGIGAKLYASSVDDGSNDNYNAVWFKIARMEESQNFDDFVPFFCEDISKENMLVLRVYEVDPGEGRVDVASHEEGGSLFSRYTDCMTRVEIQDKLGPVLIPPSDLTVSCQYWAEEDDLNSHFGSINLDLREKDSLFILDRACPGEIQFDPDNRYASYQKFVGYNGLAFDVCDVVVKDTFIITYGCNSSEIIRTFTAIDPSGNSSTASQRITIKECIPFYISDQNCDDNDPEDGVIWPCNYTTFKCDSDLDTAITGVPIIKMRTCNTIGMKYRDSEFTAPGDGCRSILREWRIIDQCYFDVELDDYHEKEWRFYQELRIVNEEAPSFTNCENIEVELGDDCLGQFVYTINASDDCTDIDQLIYHYQIDLDDNGIYNEEIVGNSVDLALSEGRHKVRWYTFDGCTNLSTCEQVVSVIDKKAPIPYCYKGLSTSINEIGETLQFWASDFDLGGFDQCNNPVVLSFSPDTNDVVLNVTCSDLENLPSDTIPIKLWITDIQGNQDFCSTYLRVAVSNNVCDDLDLLASISGDIYDYNSGKEIDMVEIYLAEGTDDFSMNQLSSDGSFKIKDLEMYKDYFLRPAKNDDLLNGVTTLDLVLIQRHILGTKTLEGPYLRLAADINNSGSLTASDLLDLRRVILGIKDHFSNNESWNFIPSDHEWVDSESPWDAPKMQSFYNLSKNEANDFLGVKIGDVNGSIVLNSTGNAGFRSTYASEFRRLHESDRITFVGASREKILGFQAAFKIERASSDLRILSDLPDFSALNYHIEEGAESTLVRISWTSSKAVDLDGVQVISFDGAYDAGLDNSFSNEVYSAELEVSDFHVEAYSAFQLHQNVPNPFSDRTKISFEVDKEGDYEISVLDVNGQTVYIDNLTLKKGSYQRDLDFSHQAAGIYLLKLASSTEQQTLKMIILK